MNYLLILSLAIFNLLPAPQSVVTLYSTLKHKGQLKSCVKFHDGVAESPAIPCDVRYGGLYLGEDLDWFDGAGGRDNRSVIKDLGKLTWNDRIDVPVVEPLPKLKEGEQRRVTIDASGADGAPGRNADGTLAENTNARKRTQSGPNIVKAVIDHVYVVHVVDDVRDFYVLFRVEALERGDSCSISWRVVPSPETAGK
jgi:hypothetical protein